MLENSLVVVGGGHAGIEAAVAAARLGCRVKLVCSDPFAIGRLSCNPAVGGLAKSHLVKEIDALGGVMPLAADASAIQYKTLNLSKGPAVHSLRIQTDKKKYPLFVQCLKFKQWRYVNLWTKEFQSLCPNIYLNYRNISLKILKRM